MSNPQSWVETTLPPGYAIYHPGMAPPFSPQSKYSWCVGAASGDGESDWISDDFPTRAEACRAAWRHWTAAALRAYGPIEWKHWNGVLSRPIAFAQGATVTAFPATHDVPRFYMIYVTQSDAEIDSEDIDEAMARFAGALIAFGEPKRGGKP